MIRVLCLLVIRFFEFAQDKWTKYKYLGICKNLFSEVSIIVLYRKVDFVTPVTAG